MSCKNVSVRTYKSTCLYLLALVAREIDEKVHSPTALKKA